jgi:hypothetical protein
LNRAATLDPEFVEPNMGIREEINKRSGLSTVISAIFVGVAIIVLLIQFWPSPAPKVPSHMFYTVDDGKTWFADDVKRTSPFMKDGKTVYRCFVYSCDKCGTTFVAYLTRQSTAGNAPTADAGDDLPPLPALPAWEVKKPGSQEWVKTSDDIARIRDIQQPKCPNGCTAEYSQVEP